MSSLPPWANGPFELMVHAESHLRGADDIDRRIALISFDNAVEVSITTYLTLNPLLRGGRSYPRDEVEKWMRSYHTKLDFFEREIGCRKISWSIEKSHMIWAHDHRNEQYHGGTKGIPEVNTLQIARTAALWVFSVLFDVSDAEAELEQALLDQARPAPPTRDKSFDLAIDTLYGIITLGEQDYYASELLFSVDYAGYRDIGGELIDSPSVEILDEMEP